MSETAHQFIACPEIRECIELLANMAVSGHISRDMSQQFLRQSGAIKETQILAELRIVPFRMLDHDGLLPSVGRITGLARDGGRYREKGGALALRCTTATEMTHNAAFRGMGASAMAAVIAMKKEYGAQRDRIAKKVGTTPHQCILTGS
ncbi:hypothetical protein CFR79_12970 [Komagataeibacter saccharivorans]|nr:hypothetical protein CFR79_12970 [Komagataeibacter saccharivorans]